MNNLLIFILKKESSQKLQGSQHSISLGFRSTLMAGIVFMTIGLMQITRTYILQAGVEKLDILFSPLLVR